MSALALIAWATLTPNAIDPAHRVPPAWCFACGDLWLTDVLSNIALFFPFGIALALFRVTWPRAVLGAALLSLAVESCQFIGIPAGRSAASADLLANTLGALLGALLTEYWSSFLRPPRRYAPWMALGWACASAIVLFITAVAVGAPPRVRTASIASVDTVSTLATDGFRPSARTHPPRFGWYGGTVDSVRLSTTGHGAQPSTPLVVRRGWGGPIMVQASRPFETLHAEVTVRGRDANIAFVPVLYVHIGIDSTPALMVGQHDGDAELRVTRRASELGLALPALRLPKAFAARQPGDTTALTLVADVGPAGLELRSHSRSESRVIRMRFTSTMGWSIVQTVIARDSILAPVAMACWIALLVAPVGWWSGIAIRGRTDALGQSKSSLSPTHLSRILGTFAVAPIVLVVLFTPSSQGIAPLDGASIMVMVAAYAVAWVASDGPSMSVLS